jgi:hypothetical protein
MAESGSQGTSAPVNRAVGIESFHRTDRMTWNTGFLSRFSLTPEQFEISASGCKKEIIYVEMSSINVAKDYVLEIRGLIP